MLRLDQDIKFLKGVGPARAELLAHELGVHTVEDLLNHFPRRYVDRSRFYRISDLRGTMEYVQVYGQILSFQQADKGAKRRLVAHFSDGTGVMDLVWFYGHKYIAQTYDCNRPYVVFGKPRLFGERWSIAHPEMEKPTAETDALLQAESQRRQQMPAEAVLFGEYDAESLSGAGQTERVEDLGCWRPVYPTTELMKKRGLGTHAIEKLLQTIFNELPPLPETLPAWMLSSLDLPSRDEAMRTVHHPTSMRLLQLARTRLKFEELFFVQLQLLRYKQLRSQSTPGIPFTRIGDVFNTFFHTYLPFTLTDAQKRVLREIRSDVRSGRQMNRLLQGDVGCGKTLVALMTALMAIDNGTQAAIMVPTEILATQHLQTLRQLLADMPVRVELLTGHVIGKAREVILTDLRRGLVNILVGTHALIEEGVQFARLGLAVIDEQHRFGVAQRARLWHKTDTPPHVLVMTATPIPRTLAMTLYGDLDVSVIDQLPPGRQPIATYHLFDRQYSRVLSHIRSQVSKGHQVYIVYPLIEESERVDLKNLEDGYEQVQREFPDCTVVKVHGRMKPAEKDAQMQRFVRGEAQIMVATTVIEVGIHVPNATTMIIQNAERFGLSQLHQLRGRVGRGGERSFCILVSSIGLASETQKRLEAMTATNDGFEIAERDLQLRGPGDLDGTQQSGMGIDLHIASLAKDGILLQQARHFAMQLIEADPQANDPANAHTWRRLQQLKGDEQDWRNIS